MSDILYFIFGEELYLSLQPDVQALLCLFVFALVAWLVVRIFHAIGVMV